MTAQQISLFYFKVLYFFTFLRFFFGGGFHLALEMNMRRSVYMGLVLRNDLVCEVTEMMVHAYHRHNGSDKDRAAKL